MTPRGYVSFGKESAKGSKHGDLKEFWHFGQYVQNNHGVPLSLIPHLETDCMSPKSFVEQVNQLAVAAKPFFFLIDFEKKKPLI